nr:MAG TPA: hypothetical protein [Caudoviricetes sp.]
MIIKNKNVSQISINIIYEGVIHDGVGGSFIMQKI